MEIHADPLESANSFLEFIRVDLVKQIYGFSIDSLTRVTS